MTCKSWFCKGLYLLGAYSYSIDLFNTMAIGITKGGMFEFTTWDGLHFVYFLPILLLAEILGPMMLEKFSLVRIPFIQKRILGE